MKIYLLLAEGFELVEAMTPVDIFRRAKEEITTVSLTTSLLVTASNGVEVKADATLGDIDILGGDALILPGGYPGYVNLANSETVGRAAKFYYETKRILGAICGAPYVLQKYGIGTGCKITSHRSVKDKLTDYTYTGKNVEFDGRLVTAIGAGHALDFSLKLLEVLKGSRVVEAIKPGLELR